MTIEKIEKIFFVTNFIDHSHVFHSGSIMDDGHQICRIVT